MIVMNSTTSRNEIIDFSKYFHMATHAELKERYDSYDAEGTPQVADIWRYADIAPHRAVWG